jgi:hypothetical protein
MRSSILITSTPACPTRNGSSRGRPIRRSIRITARHQGRARSRLLGIYKSALRRPSHGAERKLTQMVAENWLGLGETPLQQALKKA